MLKSALNKIRVLGHEALSTRRGDQYKAVRVGLELLNIANELVGRPFCPATELAQTKAPVVVATKAAASAPNTAPVMIYFEAKDHRTLDKIEQLLKAASVPYQVLDVSKDPTTQSW